jgi:hypothetical protein
MPQWLRSSCRLVGIDLADILAEHAHAAARRALQAQHLAQQRGLAGAGAADDGQDLALFDFQVQVLMHHGAAVLGPQAGDLDHRHAAVERQFAGAGAAGCRFAHQNPTPLKTIANTASARITAVIAVTTEVVVPRPGFRYSA